jgi:Caspase domain
MSDRWRLRSLIIIGFYLGACCPASAAIRHAFVVGTNTYDNLSFEKQLQKAVNDANGVAVTLQGIGFQVTASENLRRTEFNRAWQGFLTKVAPGDTVAVFLSGHGVQVGGLNYLLPRDVPKFSASDEGLLKDESISLQKLLDDLKARAPRLSLVIVDACRDNPFQLGGGRSVGGLRGLARLNSPPQGSFTIFSAGAGESALDRLPGNDPEPTSVFTRKLLPLLKRSDLTLQNMVVELRNEVSQLARKVGHSQTPAYWDELTGPKVCLAGECRDLKVVGNPPAAPVETAAAIEWKGVAKNSAAELETFIRRHPGTPEADYAKARFAEVRKPLAPPVNVPQPPATPTAATSVVPPPPRPSGPLARVELDGLTVTVDQATRNRDGVAIILRVTNTRQRSVGLAADSSIRSADNQYVTHVASLTGDDGATCYADSIQGLQEFDPIDAKRFGAQGLDKNKVDQAMTSLGASASLTASLAFGRCAASGSARVVFALHRLESENVKRVNISLPSFLVGR